MIKSNLSILFYPKGGRSNGKIEAPIYMRITVDGQRSELSVQRKVTLSKWSAQGGRAKGYSTEAKELNNYLTEIRHKSFKIFEKLVDKNEIVSCHIIKNILLGKESNQKMLLKVFNEHNNQIKSLIGKDFAQATFTRYNTAKTHIENYIIKEYSRNDIPINQVNHKFISGFEYYLKSEKSCNHNTTIKYLTNFKKIMRIAFANGWINTDPFFNWKASYKTVNRDFLSENELERMVEKSLKIPRIEQVRDIFVFCCYTGLAYVDVKNLNKNDIVIGIDGDRWIKTKRAKTNTITNIPILPVAEAIIEKYENHPLVVNQTSVLPVLSNQKMNAYLKEVADLCDIQKNLTFHLARHTFATTVTLNNGVPIESVSKMLGHKSLRTTQHYAKLLDRKVSADMGRLRAKLDKSIKEKKSS